MDDRGDGWQGILTFDVPKCRWIKEWVDKHGIQNLALMIRTQSTKFKYKYSLYLINKISEIRINRKNNMRTFCIRQQKNIQKPSRDA